MNSRLSRACRRPARKRRSRGMRATGSLFLMRVGHPDIDIREHLPVNRHAGACSTGGYLSQAVTNIIKNATEGIIPPPRKRERSRARSTLHWKRRPMDHCRNRRDRQWQGIPEGEPAAPARTLYDDASRRHRTRPCRSSRRSWKIMAGGIELLERPPATVRG